MPDHDLFEALCELVRSTAKVDDHVPITPETLLVDDLGVDSLDLVSVFLQVQDDYGVVIDEEDLPKIQSMGDLARYVEDRRSSQAA